MKRRILFMALMIGMIMGAIAQNPTISLTFTAEDNGQYVPMDSIHIENLTQGCDTNLYPPDTVIELEYNPVGIGHIPNTADNKFSVSQNYPNPFTYSTKVDLYIPDDQDVNIYVSDMPGREISRLTLSLQKGAHSFTIYPGNAPVYLLSFSGERESQTIKMINAGSGSVQSSPCKIGYNSGHETEYVLKSATTVSGFSFSLGDLLRYTGYAIMLNSNPGSDTLEDAPLINTLYTFNIHEAPIVVPTVTTDSATDITSTTATSGGNVLFDGGADVTARGVCWSTLPGPTIIDNHTSDGTGTGTFISNIFGLTENTLYYVRAYAINSAGIAYGNEISFTTGIFFCGDQFTDVDGNIYHSVQIGTQCWMKENLKTTTYNNNTPIPNVTDTAVWANLTTGAYVWYDNDSIWKDIYGALYNWYTTVDTNNPLCPSGWHVPSLGEFQNLFSYIGGSGPPHGNELKSCRQVNSPLGFGCNIYEHPRWDNDPTHWGTDNYGFSGLPGGRKTVKAGTNDMGKDGSWWSTTANPDGRAHPLILRHYLGHANTFQCAKKSGRSIRCLKD